MSAFNHSVMSIPSTAPPAPPVVPPPAVVDHSTFTEPQPLVEFAGERAAKRKFERDLSKQYHMVSNSSCTLFTPHLADS